MPENELKKILSEIEVRLKATYQYLGCLLTKIKMHIFFILNFMYVPSSSRLWNSKESIWVIVIFFFKSWKPHRRIACLVLLYRRIDREWHPSPLPGFPGHLWPTMSAWTPWLLPFNRNKLSGDGQCSVRTKGTQLEKKRSGNHMHDDRKPSWTLQRILLFTYCHWKHGGGFRGISHTWVGSVTPRLQDTFHG